MARRLYGKITSSFQHTNYVEGAHTENNAENQLVQFSFQVDGYPKDEIFASKTSVKALQDAVQKVNLTVGDAKADNAATISILIHTMKIYGPEDERHAYVATSLDLDVA